MATWPAVLDELVRTRRAGLVGYAALLTGDVAAAEDVVHDAIVKAFSRGRQFSHVNKADAYVRRAIVSVFIDRSRRERRFRDAAPVLAGETALPAHEGSIDLDRALASLSPQLRVVIVLRFFDDLTVPQIAASMGIAEGTVKRYLHEAQAALAVAYGDEFDAASEGIDVVAHNERSGP
jgi:RNA polymerase sigma-70 factor (ECF subfamily)